jgi:serine/threonine protein kinase
MSDLQTCPAAATLERFALSQLATPEYDAVEQHLLHCDDCLRALEALQADDTISQAVRRQPVEPALTDPPALRSLIDRIRALRTEPPTCAESSLAPNPSPETPSDVSTGSWPGLPPENLPLAPPQQPDELGRLGGYRVLKVLGQGGMGVVFLAEDPNLQRPVALKVMRPDRATSDSARQRFLSEARAAAAVKHDHVVTIHQVGEDLSTPFLAMELLQGEPLDARLEREGKLPVAEVLRIGREMAEGLQAAHEQRLIHRDIKPSNIWLEGKRGRVKILDFGLARAAGDKSRLTQTGTIVGTPAYMSPEQASGLAVDARTDLFSLGCVLYRMTTGRPAFQGSDTISTLKAVALDNPPPPHELNAEVPEKLSKLILRLLAKDPEDRPRTAAEVADALAAPTGPFVSSTPPAALGAPGKPRKRRRRVLAAGLLLAVAGLAWFGRSTLFSPSSDSKGQISKPLTVCLRVTRFTPEGENVRLVGVLAGDLAGEQDEKKMVYRARFNDRVEVEAALSEPAYAYLIAFNPTDKPRDQEQLVPSSEKDDEPPLRDRIIPDMRLVLNDGEGLQAFAVVASRQPLPAYTEWRKLPWPVKWKRTPATSGVVWTADGDGVSGQYEPGFQRATEEALGDKAVVRELARALKRIPGVEAAAVLGFAVDRKE